MRKMEKPSNYTTCPLPPSIKPRWELIFCRFKDSRATSSTSPDTSQKREHLGWDDRPGMISPWKLRLKMLLGNELAKYIIKVLEKKQKGRHHAPSAQEFES